MNLTPEKVESFRTSLEFEISQVQDPGLIYKTYYSITTPKLETSIKDLFVSRGLEVGTQDYSYFLNEVLPLNQYTLEDNQRLLKKMLSGDLISKNYIQESEDRVQNLRDFVDPMVPDETLSKLVDHRASSISSSSVGKGEFALVLLTGGASKPKNGGDLRIGDSDIEVKAKRSKLASQSSHLPMVSIQSEVKEWLGPEIEIKPLTTKNLQGHYLEKLGSWERVKELLEFVFSRTMFRETDFSWIRESESIKKFYEELAIREFHYYKACDNFDKILFLNPDNLNIYTTSTMDSSKIKNFNLSQSFGFRTERIQTNYWELK